MVKRVYVEKKPGLAHEAQALMRELQDYAGLSKLSGLRIINRYDVEGLDADAFNEAVLSVFSEPQLDDISLELIIGEGDVAFALEYLPGQFDQRADSAAQCIQMQTLGERPLVRTARVYVLNGAVTDDEVQKAKRYVLNPMESREASMDLPHTLKQNYPKAALPLVLTGFRGLNTADLETLRNTEGLAMDLDDLLVCQKYFCSENRDPSMTELKVIDTYWSDHCRHTTFLTEITSVICSDPAINATLEAYQQTRKELGRSKPFTLMDVGTLAAKAMKARGMLPEYEQTEENNACTLKISVDTPKGPQEWLLFFKNETHNHPTEIEPFGGAATCIGGAIRDPLSARAYVYAGMRITGAADPTQPLENTIPGKLPQRLITQGAAEGFASYGNQIGVPTGCVKEIYHPGYAAKRMEAGAVLGAAPFDHVRRERPAPGDCVLLVGGRTGRDGCGGATGSSMAHTAQSVDICASQVQKGNAPEERKLQRLFRKPEVSRLIKRCNDFGAGGVSVAIGELAAGLIIDLDQVKVKYEGLDATELAISESQERMAVVVEADDADTFIKQAELENLEATPVATVTEVERLIMKWKGHTVVDLARSFLDENGARKYIEVQIAQPTYCPVKQAGDFSTQLMSFAVDLNGCSQQGLIERFDSTVGASSVLLPLGGKKQATAPMAMVHALPVPGGTDSCSFMSYGFNPAISEKSPYHGAYLAVVESVAKLLAAGARQGAIYTSFQEFFPKPGTDPKRWGLPLAAVLGAFRAQMELSVAAIGGKDSMSGTFEHLDVPPTLISFAVTSGRLHQVISPEYKKAGSRLVWLKPELGEGGLPIASSLIKTWQQAEEMMQAGQVLACSTPGFGGVAMALMNMALGNEIGVRIGDEVTLGDLFDDSYGSLILEVCEECKEGKTIGYTTESPEIFYGGQAVDLALYKQRSQQKLSEVFPVNVSQNQAQAPLATFYNTKSLKGPDFAKPRVLIPAFPGTNCEEDTAQAFKKAGAIPEVFVVRNQTPQNVYESVHAFAKCLKESQFLLIPGGFSGGDEPDGSGKFIAAFLRSKPVSDALMELLQHRMGLVGGICNGFQALIKVGLLPGGQIKQTNENSPTLTRNLILRHQSKLVQVRIASNLSPWFAKYKVGDCYTVPISHGEGRFLCSKEQFDSLVSKGQIASQYCNDCGQPSMDIAFNPPGASYAVEALTSPDGRVMGRMGHAERMLKGLYKNVPNTGHDPMFEAAVGYFS